MYFYLPYQNVSRKDYKDHLIARIAQACDPSTLDNVEDIAKEAQLAVCVSRISHVDTLSSFDIS